MATLGGVYTGRVIDNRDPSGLARIRVLVPAVDRKQEVWARFATPMAGPDSGVRFTPNVGDEVVVAFEGGDLGSPIVLGALWNAKAPPPEAGNPPSRMIIRSRRGAAVTIEDDANASRISVETSGGQRITLVDASDEMRIEDRNGNRITLSASGVEVSAAARLRLRAGTLEISTGMLSVDASMAKFSGVVQCDTLISNSVVASSYTPGAGNLA